MFHNPLGVEIARNTCAYKHVLHFQYHFIHVQGHSERPSSQDPAPDLVSEIVFAVPERDSENDQEH